MNRILQKVVVEICTGTSLKRGPYPVRSFLTGRAGPAQQMKGDVSYGPGRQMRGDFSNGPGRVGKREVIFITSWTGPAKKKSVRDGPGPSLKIRPVQTSKVNSERLVSQAQPGIEPVTSCVPVFRAELLDLRWDEFLMELYVLRFLKRIKITFSTVGLCMSLLWT